MGNGNNGNGKLDALQRDRLLTRVDERVGQLTKWCGKAEKKIDSMDTRLGTLEAKNTFKSGWIAGAGRVIGLVCTICVAIVSSAWAIFTFIVN